MNHFLHSLHQQNVSVLTLLGLSAALDTIDYTILLPTSWTWFWHARHCSLLVTQTVTDRNCSSAQEPVCCGVPRGSVLGLVLFALYTATLSDVIDNYSIFRHSFANDSHLQKQLNELIWSMQLFLSRRFDLPFSQTCRKKCFLWIVILVMINFVCCIIIIMSAS